MKPVIRREGESIDSLIKRFKRSCNHEGIIKAYRDKCEYKKPSISRRDKHHDAVKKIKNPRKIFWK